MSLTGLAHLKDSFLNLFYPPTCQVCYQHRAIQTEGYVCAECRNGPDGVKLIEPPFCARCGLPYDGEISAEFTCSNCSDRELHFDYARAVVRYRGIVQDIIHRYKYSRHLWFEPFLGRLLTDRASDKLRESASTLIVPIPLHPVKQREREFNQATRLARLLSHATGIRCAESVLERTHFTTTQTRLSRKERLENVKEAFAFTGKLSIAGERVVLIDDVLTTGATADACARILRQHGAATVCVWTVARNLLE
ncbi:MAG: ComF family protein [Verrucomicrobiota bacterium]|nr:ComF family protein [Verrucomicrobiota bacterium]